MSTTKNNQFPIFSFSQSVFHSITGCACRGRVRGRGGQVSGHSGQVIGHGGQVRGRDGRVRGAVAE